MIPSPPSAKIPCSVLLKMWLLEISTLSAGWNVIPDGVLFHIEFPEMTQSSEGPRKIPQSALTTTGHQPFPWISFSKIVPFAENITSIPWSELS